MIKKARIWAKLDFAQIRASYCSIQEITYPNIYFLLFESEPENRLDINYMASVTINDNLLGVSV